MKNLVGVEDPVLCPSTGTDLSQIPHTMKLADWLFCSYSVYSENREGVLSTSHFNLFRESRGLWSLV